MEKKFIDFPKDKMFYNVKEQVIKNYWGNVVDAANSIRLALNNKPDICKTDFQLSAGGILNSYREGDLSFDEAVTCINAIIKEKEIR